ncbi:MAG TPA: Fe-S cluster assembly protein SufD [Thermoplasmata archaeon]|nr:Fe-S cluster assembly protein SufD [Thermoplasmata archaeon]
MRNVAVALDAKQTYVAEFASSEANLSGPAWLRAMRKSAIGRFEALGFPTQKHEDWKYTNLAPLLRVPFKPAILARPDGVVAEKLEPFTFGVLKTSKLVFVNGRYAPRLSYLRTLPEGVRILSIADVLRQEPETLESHLGHFARFQDDSFVALNTALFLDGAYLEIPKNTVVEEPIHLLFVSTSKELPTVANPRNLIRLGPASQASVIETYAGWAPEVTFTNAVTEVAAGPASVLDHYKIQRESEAAFHVATMSVDQDRNSSVMCHSMSFGGAMVRNYVHTLFRAEGGSLGLNGLFMTSETQQSDNYTRIDHAAPACTSVELYRGILDGRSRGVFNGNIYVRKDAQKTVARQTNKNLLLSKDAFVDSTPGLEILADDVKCNHASTIGQLDESAVFYLRSRGIDEEAARHMLTYAFASDVVNQVKVAPIRIRLDQLILSRLPKGSGLGESL